MTSFSYRPPTQESTNCNEYRPRKKRPNISEAPHIEWKERERIQEKKKKITVALVPTI